MQNDRLIFLKHDIELKKRERERKKKTVGKKVSFELKYSSFSSFVCQKVCLNLILAI